MLRVVVVPKLSDLSETSVFFSNDYPKTSLVIILMNDGNSVRIHGTESPFTNFPSSREYQGLPKIEAERTSWEVFGIAADNDAAWQRWYCENFVAHLRIGSFVFDAV